MAGAIMTNAQHEPQDAPAIWPRPPVVLIAFALLAFGIEWLTGLSGKLFAGGAEVYAGGAALILTGIGMAALAVRTLIRARTTIYPDKPADALVTTGMFARTRNPIYLGFVVMLLGLGVTSGSIALLLAVPLFMIYLRYRVIAREEAYLERRFGDAYREYLRTVRRWY
jgi:protein-S-isoprenylcysteine O-methyltransferase Ste14